MTSRAVTGSGGAASRDGLVIAAVAAAALVAALLLARGLHAPLAGLAFLLATGAAIGAAQLGLRSAAGWATAPAAIDWTLVRAVADASGQAVAVTDAAGRLVCASGRYAEMFGGLAPAGERGGAIAGYARAAMRDGHAAFEDAATHGIALDGSIVRAGAGGDHLVWHFTPTERRSRVERAVALVTGGAGERMGEAGVMLALVTGEGAIVAANQAFAGRAVGEAAADPAGRDFVALLAPGGDGLVRFAREEEGADPLRFVQVPIGEAADTEVLFLLLDETGAGAAADGRRGTTDIHLQGLLAMLPLGLALADRDGRFIFMNQAFRAAAGLGVEANPIYPGDLVVKEDKGAVADAVRRYAAGHGGSGDIAIRLRDGGDEPVALTVASARGLGDASALLSLKDSSEERRLQRQVAQQTKMQAVGQLAGGVAHDFNNILTAIIGHCDLMLMRHSPGDSDYDDLQHVRHNSNRAAGLVRHLLAFSRQQTLRPQVLQLPDVVSEVSNLLKRLLGETVTLVVKHGRNLGAVRADPGQLEQVIVNLAVNARDAMPGGGTLTIQTYAVDTAAARRAGHPVLVPADYTALRISDTGTGIPPEIRGKIFEPFFTTKDVGKGTGLGLSTVYGIVKQSGGYIFAEGAPGEGASFAIYLPVHRAVRDEADQARPAARVAKTELWGSGTVLVVEDEDMVRAVAERALTRQGYRVLVAANGEEALEMLGGEERIDLLLSDVMMPVMDGPTLVRAARERFPDMPVLFMSGYAEEQLRRSIDLDRVAFLSKPFSVQQLAEATRAAMPQTAD